MSAIYPVSVHRRIERQRAERIKSPSQIRGQIVVGTERMLQRAFNNEEFADFGSGKSDRGPAATRSVSTT